jgi:hypothetical protein
MYASLDLLVSQLGLLRHKLGQWKWTTQRYITLPCHLIGLNVVSEEDILIKTNKDTK